jgi:N-acylneuraminate cytidylyltransferase
MSKLALIPARGGSKRIPRKNCKDFLGKPIIAYSIEAALNSKLFDEVMVSTDDDEIAKVATEYGAKVPFKRSNKNSDDYATTFDVILEVIEQYKNLGKEYDEICCIYPCAPFIESSQLIEAYKKLVENHFDSVYPVVKYASPIQRALKEENNSLSFVYPQYRNTRSQDLQPCYFDAGQFYWMKTKEVLAFGNLFTKNTGFIEVNELYVQDIDNISDWKIAETKYVIFKKME